MIKLDRDVLGKLIEFVEDELEDDSIEITGESSFIDDLELSSFECLSLVGSVEEEFNVKFSNSEVNEMTTLAEMKECILSKQN